MYGSTYIKLADAARRFVEQDDIWQAGVNEKISIEYRKAIDVMPEVLAEAAILILGVTRCGMLNALETPNVD